MRLEDARPYELRPGAWVSAQLQASESSLAQHRDRLTSSGMRMTHELARKCGYAEAEILAVLGPETEVAS